MNIIIIVLSGGGGIGLLGAIGLLICIIGMPLEEVLDNEGVVALLITIAAVVGIIFLNPFYVSLILLPILLIVLWIYWKFNFDYLWMYGILVIMLAISAYNFFW